MASSVYLIFGEDEFFVSEKSSKLVNSLVNPDNRDFGLEVIDGTVNLADEARQAIDNCMAAIFTVGMFSTDKVVWLRSVNFLHDSKVGKAATVKDATARLAEAIKKGLPDDITLIISASKVDKRHSLYKACKAAGEIEEFPLSEQTYKAEQDIAKKLTDFSKELGLSFDEPARHAFIERMGNNTRQIVCELEKLSVYLGDRKNVTENDVTCIVSSSRSSMAWDIADAFAERNLGKALAVLKQLLFQKESPLGLVIALENRIRDLMIFKEGTARKWIIPGGRSASWGEVPPVVDQMFSREFERDPRTGNNYRMGILARQAGKYSRKELKKCYELALKAHESLVSNSIPDNMVLELLLINMIT